MGFSLSTDAVHFQRKGMDVAVPFESVLTGMAYHRPEKRLCPLVTFRAHLKSIHDNAAEINLVDDSRGFLIPVRICAERHALDVKILAGSIVESKGLQWRLMELSVMTGLLETKTTDAGYYLLPDYSGALASFRERPPCKNRDAIYMRQEEWEKFGTFNAFGAVFNGTGVLGIVNQGDFFAYNDTEFNQGGINRSYVSFGIRHTPDEVLPQEAKQVIFRHVDGAKDYVPLAFEYRQYLAEEHKLVPLRARMAFSPVLDYMAHALFVKIFFGQKQPFQGDGHAPYVSCTTFAEAEEILDALREAGIAKAQIFLVGWNNGGHDGSYPTRFPVNCEAGGETGLRKLIEKAKGMGFQIGPHDNVTDVYMAARDFDPQYVSKDETGMNQSAGLWAGGLSFKSCPVVYMDRYGGDFARIQDLGFRGTYYLDAQATGLFRCTDPAHPADERQFGMSLARILEYPREMFGAVACETCGTYMLRHTDQFACLQGSHTYSAMKQRLPAEFTQLVDRVVPFLNIAVHGYVTYHAGRELLAFLLGGSPNIEVSYRALANGTEFKETIQGVAAEYKLHFELVPEIQEAFLESYEEHSPSAATLVYDCGVKVEVNAGETPAGGLPPGFLRITRLGEVVYERGGSGGPQ